MADKQDPENTLVMETTHGTTVIALRPDLAPQHVARIKELARTGFYDGVVFHRVIDGFMAQTGDPTGTGWAARGQPQVGIQRREAHPRHLLDGPPASLNSADSQFFICFDDAPWLNRQYTVWGLVVEGMENIDKIKRGEPVPNPDQIVSMKVAADAA